MSHVLDLTGRVAVVTGASGAIGSAIARRLREAGASIVVHGYTNIDRAERLARELAGNSGESLGAVAIAADLTEPDGATHVARGALRAFGHLDIWVNNAGVQPVNALMAQDLAEFEAVIRGNLSATFSGTHAAASVMTTMGSSGEGRAPIHAPIHAPINTVINIASIEGLQPAAGHSHYSAAKAAILAHTRAAAAELGPRGIRVNAIAPGLIERDGLQSDWPEGVARWHAACPLGRLGRGDDVADAVLFLASPMARWISGATLVVDGGVLTRETW